MNLLKSSIGKRRQLFEIQDFPWCPKAVRDGVTDLLVLNLKIVPLYEPTIPILSKLSRLSEGKWVDLCAGAGGGSILLKDKMPGEIKELTLTDLYPHQGISKSENTRYYPESIDARNVPQNLTGLRTLFTSLHHLNDDVAREVFRNAMKAKTPIAAFEFTNRNLLTLLSVLPSFIFSFFLIPLIFPWKASRFFWTYILPLIPLVTFIDIIMSCFRTRDEAELKELIKDLSDADYTWEIGKLPTYFKIEITYIVGRPKAD